MLVIKKLILVLMLLVIFSNNVLALELDKEKHVMAGFVIGVGTTELSDDPFLGMSMSCLAGAGKEFYDMNGKGTLDFKDFAYTCASGAVTSYLYHWVKGKLK